MPGAHGRHAADLAGGSSDLEAGSAQLEGNAIQPEEGVGTLSEHTAAPQEGVGRLSEHTAAPQEGADPLASGSHITPEDELSFDQGLARQVLSAAPDPVFVIDAVDTVIDLNPAAEAVFGYPRERAVGASLSSLIVPLRYQAASAELLRGDRVAASGLRRHPLQLTAIRANGSELFVELTLVSLRSSPRLRAAFVRDVTLPHRAVEASELLSAASAALDSSLDPRQTMRTIAQVAIPKLAQLCILDRLQDDGTIGGSVAASIDAGLAAKVERLRYIEPLDADGRHPVARALRLDAPVVVHQVRRVVDDVAADVDSSEQLLLDSGYRSTVVLRLHARGRVLGALSFMRISDLEIPEDDLRLMRDLADRAAVALDNANLYAGRAEVAQILQRSLLPEALPQLSGLELACAYHPIGAGNEVGGDFYDVFERLPSECWLVVGDVCGKGPDAAALTALLRHSVRALAFQGLSPAEVLRGVNDLMLSHQLDERFATAVLAQVKLSARSATITIASAGHPSPLLLDRDGNVNCLEVEGMLLGIVPSISESELKVSLQGGMTIVLYTDGILDAGAPQRPLTSADLCAWLQGANQGPVQIVSRLDQIAHSKGAGHLRDDIAILAAKIL